MILPEGDFRGQIKKVGGVYYISTTSFIDAVTCPRRAYNSKVLGIQLRGPQSAALKFGSAVHAAIETYLREGVGKLPPFENYWGEYSDVPLSYNAKEVDWYNLLSKGVDIVSQFVEVLNMWDYRGYFTTTKGEPTIEVQAPYRINKRIVLTRTIDAILNLGGVPTVVDFKTAARMYSEGLQDQISEQLTAYSLPHDLEGVPQPAQAMFIVGTKTKTPGAAAFPVERSQHRLDTFVEDVKAVVYLMAKDLAYRNRHFITCGSLNNPSCDYYPLCYGGETNEIIRLYENYPGGGVRRDRVLPKMAGG